MMSGFGEGEGDIEDEDEGAEITMGDEQQQ